MSNDSDSRVEQPDQTVNMQVMQENEFRKKLESLLNEYSKENGSNTPDFILRDYLVGCLDVFDAATKARSKWYGHDVPEYSVAMQEPIGREETEG